MSKELDKIIASARKSISDTIEVVRAHKASKASESADGIQAHITVSAFGAPTCTFRIYRKGGFENAYPESTKVKDKFWDNFRPADKGIYEACQAVALDKFKEMA